MVLGPKTLSASLARTSAQLPLQLSFPMPGSGLPRVLEVLLVDFEDAAAAGVEVLEEGLAECVPFLEVAPSLFPLATALVTFATAWISGLEGERGAGYVTAEELIPDVAPKALSRKAKPEAKKKPTVAVLAAQQLEIAEALQALTTQVQHLALSGSREERTPQQVKAPSHSRLAPLQERPSQRRSPQPLQPRQWGPGLWQTCWDLLPGTEGK